MAQIRIDDEVYERLKRSAEIDSRSVGQQIDYLLKNRLILEDIADKLQGTPAGGVSEKENSNPQKTSGLKPVRSKHVVNAELFAVRGEKRNVLQAVQAKAAEEYWTDEESLSYAHQLEVELDEKEQRLVDELNGLEG